MDNNPQIINIYLQEYDHLKNEQTSRIGFRDNLLYVTLAAFGGILSFAISKQVNYYALLVIPWVCLILGWTYLINDEKITAIGSYINDNLTPYIKKELGLEPENKSIFAWEIEHKKFPRRARRKLGQLIIDEITFVLSGITALSVFYFQVSQYPRSIQILWWLELIFLLILGLEIIVVYRRLSNGRINSGN